MKQSALVALNDTIKHRKLAIVITDLTNGTQTQYDGLDTLPEKTALCDIVARQLAKSKSITTEIDGKEYFIGIYRPAPKMVILGAVHAAQALAPMARLCGFDVKVIDPRGAFAEKERFPGFKVEAEWPDVAFEAEPLDPFTAFVALTHDPKIDDIGLEAAFKASCFYIGALGSKKTNAKRLDRFKEHDFITADMMAKLDAPIGLDINSSTPAEIAVSIMASVVQHWRSEKS